MMGLSEPRLHCRDPQFSPSSGASCSLFLAARQKQCLKEAVTSKLNFFMLIVTGCFAIYEQMLVDLLIEVLVLQTQVGTVLRVGVRRRNIAHRHGCELDASWTS